MEKRIHFNLDKIRILFFKRVLEANGFNSWKELYFNFNILRQTFDKYKSGNLTLPEFLFNRMISKFDKEVIDYFMKNISYYDSNWGFVKGGKITYSNHKHIFDKGREKAIKTRKERTPRFDINLPLNKELSHFIGLLIGDGFTNKYGRYYLTQFTGNKLKEKEYYEEIIAPRAIELFGFPPKIKEESKTNALRVNFYSIDIFNMITKRFEIEAGRKTRDVIIPREILNSDSNIILSCIAGIFDAEGCLYFDKREIYKSSYPAIALNMKNPSLIKQISKIFDNHNLKHSISGNYKTLQVYGVASVKDFLKKVKLLNTKYSKDILKII
ncbi:MAG: hypothetical protein ABIH37_01185 [archaeon]